MARACRVLGCSGVSPCQVKRQRAATHLKHMALGAQPLCRLAFSTASAADPCTLLPASRTHSVHQHHL